MRKGGRLSISGYLRTILRSFFMMLIGAMTAFIIVGVYVLNAKPELSVWHRADLKEEFSARSPVHTLSDYVALEDRLFSEVKIKVYDRIALAERTRVNRYNAGSLSDPEVWQRNWNRTFELKTAEPQFTALLLHGYSDSPYSLRSLGLELNAQGAHVLGLRLPGHGTAPSSLKFTSWTDMSAAVRIAATDLARRFPNKPLFVAGYSNGAALAVNYALDALDSGGLPRPAGLILLSPEIAITPAAALARVQGIFGHVLGLDKLSWSSIGPEYDPFKYNSFAINAAIQARSITKHIQKRIQELEEKGRLEDIPPILAGQSAVDATVTAREVVTSLFNRLSSGNHRLIVFDINQMFQMEGLIRQPPVLDVLLSGPKRDYDISIVGNRNAYSNSVVVRERLAGSDKIMVSELGLTWPAEVYSLSHVALPFPPDDPLYGTDEKHENPGLKLGRLALRGEVRVTDVPSSAMTRLHWNPFHSYFIDEINNFVRTHSNVVGN